MLVDSEEVVCGESSNTIDSQRGGGQNDAESRYESPTVTGLDEEKSFDDQTQSTSGKDLDHETGREED